MKIGITGTREIRPDVQMYTFSRIVSSLNPASLEVHHGDCVGADAQAHGILRHLGAYIIGHPPVDEAHRAFCDFDETYPRKTHFARNRDIVDETDILFVLPLLMVEQDRGGTWYTANYARKLGKWIVIIWPDGSVQSENDPL